MEDADGPAQDQGTAGALARAAESASRSSGGFVPSRWETVDPTDVAAGAVTTSKWESVAGAAGAGQRGADSDSDVDGVPMEETPGNQTAPAPSQPPVQEEDSRSQSNTAPGSPDL